ncbi:MAG: hypothetical protein JXR14_08450 [Paracoccaceae bacterium]
MSEKKPETHSNPFCKCNPCSCELICTCGLDKENPVAFESSWNAQEQVMTYMVKLKPKS